jgi:predicted nucleic acid-binding protein
LARRSEEQKRSQEFPILLNELQKQVPADKITWISPAIRIIYHDTIDLVRDTSGALNFHDSMMALACRELEIKFIISFDQDFDNIAWLKRISDPEDIESMLDTSLKNL